MYRSTIGF